VVDSFYAQHQLEALHMNHSILEEMTTCGSGKTDLELRTLMGCFLFGGDDISKKIKVLSGGEKARVALAKTIVSKANFLLLDEPTNHLDMHSVELLIESLNKYEGSFILVSHDRYFVSQTANKIWEIDNYEIKEFNGGYEEWMEWKERMAAKKLTDDRGQLTGGAKQQAGSGNSQAPQSKEPSTVNRQPSTSPEGPSTVNSQQSTLPPVNTAPTTANRPFNKEAQRELQKAQKELARLEEKLNALTKQKGELEAQLANPDVYSDKAKFVQAEAAYNQSVANLAAANKEYEAAFEKVMELEG
jgi:ATP-binding cassette, subfamily F, member 3